MTTDKPYLTPPFHVVFLFIKKKHFISKLHFIFFSSSSPFIIVIYIKAHFSRTQMTTCTAHFAHKTKLEEYHVANIV